MSLWDRLRDSAKDDPGAPPLTRSDDAMTPAQWADAFVAAASGGGRSPLAAFTYAARILTGLAASPAALDALGEPPQEATRIEGAARALRRAVDMHRFTSRRNSGEVTALRRLRRQIYLNAETVSDTLDMLDAYIEGLTDGATE